MRVKRYEVGGDGPREQAEGDWVRFEEYEALRVVLQGIGESMCKDCATAARRAIGWCKYDDGDCHKDDPCDGCPKYSVVSIVDRPALKTGLLAKPNS
jgi:hypothetical protein